MSDSMKERARKKAEIVTDHFIECGTMLGEDRGAVIDEFAGDLTAFAKAEVERALEEAAKIAERWDGPVTDSEFVNAQAIAAQQIASYIRTLKDTANDQ